MSDTEIILFDHLGLATVHRTKTDPNGRYGFGGLVASVYTLQALRSGYVSSSGSEGERTLKLSDGQRVEGVNLALRRGGIICGRVLDANGGPVPNAEIRGVQAFWLNGTATTSWGRIPSWSRTDNNGGYCLEGLETGRYYVSTMLGPGAARQSPLGHAPTYAPGKTRLEDAQSVWVSAGKNVANVNISLSDVRWFRVSGTVFDSHGDPAAFEGEGIHSIPPPGQVIELNNVYEGPEATFTAKLPAGNYTLAVTRSNGEFGRVRVRVADKDVNRVVIRTSPGATISGRLEIEGIPSPEPSSISVGTYAAEPADTIAPSEGFTKVDSDGTFMLSNLFGPRRFWIYSPVVGWALDAVWVDGRNVTDTPVTFEEGRKHDVRLVMTNKTTHLRCMVLDRHGHPSLAQVLVYSPDPAKWYPGSRFERSGMIVDEAQFDGLAPGNYLALAIPIRHEIYGAEDIELHEYLRSLATSFALHAGETENIVLRLVVPPRR